MSNGPIRDAGERLRRGDPYGALGLIRSARDGGAAGPQLDLLEAGASLEAGRPGEAMRIVTRISSSAEPEVRARATLWWGRILAAQGDPDGARARVAEALDVDDGLNSDEALDAEVDLAELDGRLGDVHAVTRMVEVARLLDESEDPCGAARVLVRVADVHLARRAWAEADRWLAAAEERAGPSNEPGLLVPVWERAAEVALRLREPTRALLLARRALARAPNADAATRAHAWGLVGRAHALHGDLEGAAGAHRRSAEIAERAGLRGLTARLDEVAALLASGRPTEVARRLDALAPLTRHDPADGVHAALSIGADASASSFAERLRRIGRWAEVPEGRSEQLAAAIDRAAERCSDRARDGSGSGRDLARAVRLRGTALRVSEALGDTAEASRQAGLLQALGGLGAPVPAGPFDLVRKIGWGAVGDVWRARHHEHRVAVAVKVLSRRHDSPRMAQLFLTEVRAMAVLDHPNIVRVLGTGTLGTEAAAASHAELRSGHPWFAMELADGGTLDGVRGRLPWSSIRAVLSSLLDALAHAHARGVVHLDLKCANTLLRREEGRTTVMLSDFGLAKLVYADTTRGAVVGTPTTMTPEQFRGEARDLGPWTDLYALGAVAVELLTGRPVFDVGDTLDAQREAHLEVPFAGLPADSAAPPGFEDWLKTLLAKDPADRFQRAADASHALSRLQDVPDRPVPEAPFQAFQPRSFTLSRHTVEDDSLPIAGAGHVGAERPWSPDRPPAPSDWRPLVDRAPTRDFVDVAPTLFGLARVPLVGREAERDRLWRELCEVAGGGGPRFVALCGSRGSGRTALARWLCERAHELGAATVLDATGGLDGMPGLRALVERHLRLTGLDTAAATARVRGALPDLAQWVAEDLAALVVEHGFAQSIVDRVGSVATMVRLLAAGRPVVLRMARGPDDDPAERVLRQLLLESGTPVLGLVEATTADDDEVELAVGPLDHSASDALLDALLPLAAPARRAVARTAEGHPDLLVGIVGDLLERDVLQRGPTTWELRPGEVVSLPERVSTPYTGPVTTAVLAASGPDRTAIAALALLGEHLDGPRAQVACEAAGTNVRALSSPFRELMATSADGVPRFHHPAVRAVVLDAFVDLMAAEAAAAAVEQHPEGCEVLHAMLVVRAGRLFEAPPLLLVAAERLLDEGDPKAALDALDRRAEILQGLGRDPSGAEQVPDALLRARVAKETGDPDAATLLAIGCALAERHEAHGPLGEARLWKAEVLADQGDPSGAHQELRHAADAFARAGDVVGTARAMRSAGWLAFRTGDPTTARSLLERSLRRLGHTPSAERADTLAALAAVARAVDDLDGAEAHLRAAEAESGGAPPLVQAAVDAVSAALARDRGDPAGAEVALRRALSRVPWHDVGRVRDLQSARAVVAIAAGRFGEARRLLDGLPSTPIGTLCQLVLAARGDEATWTHALAAAGVAAEPPDRDVAWLFDAAGRRAAAEGASERARAGFAAAQAQYERLGLRERAAAVAGRAAALDRPRG